MRGPASSFVGRETELARLADLFESARLVTLLGPGGMGKTRLALSYAEANVATFGPPEGGGIWFVDLSESRTVSEALATVAAVLDVPLRGLSDDETTAEAIGRGIATLGRTLIVLDNLEPVAEGLAAAVERWVRGAPSARLLATSRMALGVDAEHVLPLGSLAPADAAILFVTRARQVRPDLESAPADVAAIVEAIDRMPLAIELAAARVRLLGLSDLRARLAQPLKVLRRGNGGTDPRHGSVRRAVLDSVDLLPTSTRRLFALVSVFRRGVAPEDAEAVLGGLDLGEVLDGLDALVRTSLLRVEDAPGGRTRLTFFETIREVALELAAEDPAREVAALAHSRHFASRAASLGPDREAELENLLHAHETATARARRTGDAEAAEDAVRIALALEPLGGARGLSRRRERLLDATLAALDAAPAARSDDEARARLRLGRGLAADFRPLDHPFHGHLISGHA